ncbi:PREDICTED: uncharacterized protein LOC104772854 [Camelina sativa]|uniref:Uncharacterized protein LOC104772854 n=2 Tax=Camelina sativa TaxID=90675 RepID=A0ABM0Y580_CAMSA|nr:PREDICTED: uncharacterized protein LOC104772854 [Camelina sativa]
MANRDIYGGNSRADEKTASEALAEELNRNEINMKMRYGEIRRRDKGVPIGCNCGAVLLVATSNDPTTRGERYFSCPYDITDGPGQGCGFRKWWTDAVREEFRVTQEEKNEMKQDLDATKKRIEIQEEMILYLEKKYDALEKKFESLNKYL